jgi:cytochrome b561
VDRPDLDDRNKPMASASYGRVTKTLHWLTVAALACQFVIGYLLHHASGHGRSGHSGHGHGGGSDDDGRSGSGRGGDDFSLGFGAGDDTLATVHVGLGLTILTLAVVRLLWRRATALPAWAPGLSQAERVLATWTERTLYLCLFLIPLTGISLLLVSDDLLALHVATHIAFFVALAAHLGLVLKHQLIDRDRLLERMI